MRAHHRFATAVTAICLTFSSAAPVFAQGTWQTKTPMPAPSLLHAVVAIDGILYVAGGYDSQPVPTLYAYNPTTDTWTTLPSMPDIGDGPPGRTAAASAVINGKMAVIGGSIGPITPIPTSAFRLFDPSTNIWSTLASMPTNGHAGLAGVIGGKLYVTVPSLALHIYDILTNTWTTSATPPPVFPYAAGGAINGKLYSAGGSFNVFTNATTNLVSVYDPGTDMWTAKAPMPVATQEAAGAIAGTTLYAAGGFDGTQAMTALQVYNAVTDTWTTLTPMNFPRFGAGAAVINGKLYVVGGAGPGGTGPNGTTNVLEVFTPPPLIGSVTASPPNLATANRRMTRVTVTVATNPPGVACSITNVSFNTQQAGVGPDWQLISPLVVDLRAERPIGGVNRLYTITVTCDGVTGTVEVPVLGVR